jgi:hypothetical protein
MKALLALVLLCAAARPAAALLPLPNSEPDWRADKAAALAALDRVEDANRGGSADNKEVRRVIAQLRQQANAAEVQVKRGSDRQLLWVRANPEKLREADEITRRLRWLFSVHMRVVYGWMVPAAFNEAFKQAAAGRWVPLPGYPLAMATTDDEYCRTQHAISREVADILAAAGDSGSAKVGPDFCDSVGVPKP